MSFENQQYLRFDDRKLMAFGIIIISCIFPLLFFENGQYTYLERAHLEIPESLLFTSVFWFSYRFILIKLRKQYPHIKDTFKRLSILSLIVLIATPFISKIIKLVVEFTMNHLVAEQFCEIQVLKGTIATYVFGVGVMATYEAVYFFKEYGKAIKEKERIQTAHVQSQLDNLRNQINPHFLFNSLNTLMNLIPKDPDRATNYLTKLSKFYRYSVSYNEDTTVPIQHEIENARNYADLLHERFGDNINITIKNPTKVNVNVLPMSLQLLIENAVKHNIVSKNKPLYINIEVDENANTVTVENNLQRKIHAVSSTGIGLENIKKRIAYFTKDKMKIDENLESFTVSIPLIPSMS